MTVPMGATWKQRREKCPKCGIAVAVNRLTNHNCARKTAKQEAADRGTEARTLQTKLRADFYAREQEPKRREADERFRALGAKCRRKG